MKALAAVAIQAAIRAEGLDGWLFYSFRGSDPIAENILRVHAIESETLDRLPGQKMDYLPWQ